MMPTDRNPPTADIQVTAAEIADLAAVSRAAVSNWRRRYDDFPEPVAVAPGGGDLFRLDEVERWLRGRGRLTGPMDREKSLWQAVEAKQQMVVARLEKFLRARHERRDIVRMVVARRLHLHPNWRREGGRHLLHALHRGFETGHRIMREQGNEQDFIHSLALQIAHRLRNGGILVAHRQINWNRDPPLELRLHIAAGDHERGADNGPYLPISRG